MNGDINILSPITHIHFFADQMGTYTLSDSTFLPTIRGHTRIQTFEQTTGYEYQSSVAE